MSVRFAAGVGDDLIFVQTLAMLLNGVNHRVGAESLR
jgi:hypothetical protein